ncbi:MAG: glycosyltransferase family 39 protein [Bacteroidota bacterium]
MAKKDKQEKLQKKKSQAEKGGPSRWLAPAFIFLFSFLLYSNTLEHEYVMDDGAMIADNATTRMGYKGMKQFFKESSVYGATKENYGTYRPLTMATFAFDWGFYKMKLTPGKPLLEPPRGQRVVHIIMYALCCVLLFFVLKKLLRDFHPLIPLVATLIFAAHPLHTEVGAFIKSRDELLSMLFIFSSLWFLLSYLESRKRPDFILSNAMFFLALFSKESAITFVIIFPLALYFFTGLETSRIFRLTVLNFAWAAIYMMVRYSVLDADKGYMPVINNTLVEAHGAEKLSTILFIMLQYLRLLVYPHPLTWDYGYNQVPITGWNNMLVIASLVIHLALAAYAVMKFREKHILSFCIIFYFITISISSNLFVLISSVMAERFLFIPSIAFSIAVAYLLTKALAKKEQRVPVPLTAAMVLILAAFSFKTFARNEDWKSNFSLFESGAKASPNSYRANTAFAWQCLHAGEMSRDTLARNEYFKLAIYYYTRAIDIYKGYETYRDYYNRGVARNYLKDTEGASQDYISAYNLNKKDLNTCYNVGVIYYNKKQYDQSIKYWLEAAAINEEFMDLNFKIGNNYFSLNDYPSAAKYFEKYYRTHPNSMDAAQNLMVTYNKMGDTANANKYALILESLRQKNGIKTN